MAKDTPSLAPSEAATLAYDADLHEERTTLTGKSIGYTHDSMSGMMLDGGGGFAATGAGANLSPPGYTDRNLVSIPIKMSDVEGESDVKAVKKNDFFSKLSSKRNQANDDFKVVEMSREDYSKYCRSARSISVSGTTPNTSLSLSETPS